MTVYGISFDDVATQAAFAEAQGLKYLLLSDPDASVGAKYGVLRAGRKGFAQRFTFIIDPAGVLRHIDKKVDVRKHGADLVALIGQLQEKAK